MAVLRINRSNYHKQICNVYFVWVVALPLTLTQALKPLYWDVQYD